MKELLKINIIKGKKIEMEEREWRMEELVKEVMERNVQMVHLKTIEKEVVVLEQFVHVTHFRRFKRILEKAMKAKIAY